MRFPKGYDLVCGLAAVLGRTDVELVIRRVIVQNTDRRLVRLAQALKGPTFVDGVLSPGHYLQLLEESDILLLPYRSSEFYSRTSGIFADAMNLGKPMVGTADTWLGNHIERLGAGETFRDGDVEDLARALSCVVDRLPAYRHNVAAAREEWLAGHNPGAAADFLLGFARRPGRDRTAGCEKSGR